MDHHDVMQASRRNVLLGAGVIGAGAVLVGCSGGDKSAPSSTESTSSAGASAGDTFQVADVPVGGGVIAKDAKIVVTQPKAGQFHAFSAVCTHKGCTVSRVADGTIDCPCHGSKFSDVDGSVVEGPAGSPLPAKTATVSGGTLTVS